MLLAPFRVFLASLIGFIFFQAFLLGGAFDIPLGIFVIFFLTMAYYVFPYFEKEYEGEREVFDSVLFLKIAIILTGILGLFAFGFSSGVIIFSTFLLFGILFRMDSRYMFLWALFFLWSVILSLLADMKTTAETFSIYLYYALCFGVYVELVDGFGKKINTYIHAHRQKISSLFLTVLFVIGVYIFWKSTFTRMALVLLFLGIASLMISQFFSKIETFIRQYIKDVLWFLWVIIEYVLPVYIPLALIGIASWLFRVEEIYALPVALFVASYVISLFIPHVKISSSDRYIYGIFGVAFVLLMGLDYEFSLLNITIATILVSALSYVQWYVDKVLHIQKV